MMKPIQISTQDDDDYGSDGNYVDTEEENEELEDEPNFNTIPKHRSGRRITVIIATVLMLIGATIMIVANFTSFFQSVLSNFQNYHGQKNSKEVQSSTIDDSKNNNNRMNDFQYEKEAHHVHAKHGATTLQLQQQQQQTDVGVVESKESLIYPNGLDFKVISTIPHDTSSFTQGLSYYKGILYESTGLYHHSKVRRLDPSTGKVLATIDMENKYFGEGLTYHPPTNTLIQITWKSAFGFVYNATTLQTMRRFRYKTETTEGWGITYIPETEEFVVSDGSAYLQFWNASLAKNREGKVWWQTTANDNGDDYLFTESRQRVQAIVDDGLAKNNLNELEYVNGVILANVWFENVILIIDPQSGKVVRTVDFAQLWPAAERKSSRGADVFNGISVSDIDGELFVTGKKWPTIYKVSLKGLM